MSRKLSDFGTEVWPLRPSSLDSLIRCPMSVVLRSFLPPDEGGKGAHTGSVTHAGVEQFHRTLDDEEGIRALLSSVPRFPLADVDKATLWYRAYVGDTKNRTATVTHLEHKVTLRTHGFVVTGTLDQLRLTPDGHHEVWDLKTGSFLTPAQMRKEHRYQQAAYVLAARQTLGLDVRPGGLIRVHGYSLKRGDVFLKDTRTVAECEEAMLLVAEEVNKVRRGDMPFQPGDDACRFCPAKPHPQCLELLK